MQKPSCYHNVCATAAPRVLDRGLIALKLRAVLFITHKYSVSCKVLMNTFTYAWILLQASKISGKTGLFITFLFNNTFVIGRTRDVL